MHLTKKGCGIKIISAKLIIFLLEQKKEKYIFKQVCISLLWKYKLFFIYIFFCIWEREKPQQCLGLGLLAWADMTLITDDWLQSCLLQIIPHMFLHTIPTILILDNIRIYLMGFYILCKQYCTWLNSILHFFCSFVFSYFASFLFISCGCAFYVFVF